jgi:hypothetical protein
MDPRDTSKNLLLRTRLREELRRKAEQAVAVQAQPLITDHCFLEVPSTRRRTPST